MTLPSTSATLSANHNQSLYSRAKFTRAKPDYISILLGIHHEQSTPVEGISNRLNSAAPSELRDEDFISKFSELKDCLEAKNLSGSELSYVEMLILQKIQARFREYYSRTEPVDSFVAALAERARLFLNSQ
jgi:hypothetical protein